MLTNDQIKKIYAKALAAQNGGRLDEAAKGYSKIIKAAPNVAEAQFNLARIYAAKRQVAQAAQHFEAALKLKPAQPEIWLAYLSMASQHPNVGNLEKLLTRAGASFDKFPELTFYRGLVAARRGKSEARALLEKALSEGLKSARALTELGVLQAESGETDAALTSFNAALELKPNYDFALARKADLLRNMGDFDAALEAAREAIRAAPNQGPLYYSYASIRKMQSDDPAVGQMKTLLPKLDKNGRGISFLGHALAKAMEDTGQPDQVFRYLDIANKATAKAFPYGYEADRENNRLARETFKALVASEPLPAKKTDKPTPIFVTGMPRSGTTLVEQILASHSSCEGAGEISLLGPLLDPVFKDANGDLDRIAADLETAGNNYQKALAERFPNATYVTDKSISTYALVGFVRYALPDAKIIVVRRDPRDNALSVYKNMFKDGLHRYATDLQNIARFFGLFEEVLEFWRAETPGAFTEIWYEDLISDPEARSRKLVAAAGLDWEDACLSFYENNRRVDTLSTTQVRQPIYSSSVGAWKKYEKEMQPFLEEYEAQQHRK